MADVTDSERYGKRVKHTRKTHYVGGGLFGGVREVGKSHNTEPLPEDMKEEPEYGEVEISHSEAVSVMREEYGLPKKYLRITERELWSKGLCPLCETKTSQRACKDFLKKVSHDASRHFEPCCPECGEWLEEFKPVRAVTDMSFDEETEITMPEIELKQRVEPCGCIIEEQKYFPQARVPENNDTKSYRLANLKGRSNVEIPQEEKEKRWMGKEKTDLEKELESSEGKPFYSDPIIRDFILTIVGLVLTVTFIWLYYQ